MWNSDQYQRNTVKEEDHQKDDHAYTFLSDGSNLHQLDELLDDELEREKTILCLNDDCFYKIFSYLPANDLCAVSETCRDFQRLSHFYVEGYSKRFRLEQKNFYANRDQIRLSDAKRFIRNFGPYLTELSLKNNDFQSEEKLIRLLPLLDRYCIKLRDLLIDVSYSNPMTIFQSEQLISNLQRLSIGAYMRPNVPLLGPIDVDAILTHFAALKHFELTSLRWIVSGSEAYAAKRYETLESLLLRNSILPRIDMVTAFLRENCHLKRIKLSSCFFSEVTNKDHFTLTLPANPNLESFRLQFRDAKYPLASIDISDMRIQELQLVDISGDVSALKKLCIDLSIFQKSNLNSLLARLAGHNKIENVGISNANKFPNELVSHLCALSTLKVLTFGSVRGFNNGIIKALACGLPNLTYVAFKSCDADYTMIENFMEFSYSTKTIFLFTYYVPRIGYLPLTKAILSSMVNARLRNKQKKETLTLILNRKILSDASKYGDGVDELLLNCANVINVLPS